MAMHAQILSLSYDSKARHHTDNLGGLETEVDFALTEDFHH